MSDDTPQLSASRSCPHCGKAWQQASDEGSECCPECSASAETQGWSGSGALEPVFHDPLDLLQALQDEFEVGEKIGQGGLGIVFRARPRRDRSQEVAIKLLRTSFAEDSLSLKRFLREIAICERLVHPRIVRALGHGSFHGEPYLVLEYCNEGSFERLYEQRPDLPPLKWVRLMEKVLQGVEFAHAQGLVHRDMKPENVLIHRGSDRRVRPKVSDFGLSKAASLHGSTRMTSTGAVAGTLQYMPREQLLDFRNVTPAADVWSLGAMLFRFLTRRPARPVPAGVDPLLVVLNERPDRLREVAPQLPRSLTDVVDRALAIEPAERFPDASQMRVALVAAMRDMN